MGFSGLGSGIVSDPFQITTPAQFREMNGFVGTSVFTGTGINDLAVSLSSPGYNGALGDYYTFTIKSVQPISGLLYNAQGSGYAVGNTVSVNGGLAGHLAVATITSVNGGGGVTGFTLTDPGSGYSVISSVGSTAITGIGTGLTFRIQTVDNDYFTWKKNTGAESSLVQMWTPNSIGSNNLSIQFATLKGHTIGDIWVLTVTKCYFKLMNNLDFTAESGLNRCPNIAGFFHKIDGQGFTVDGLLSQGSTGIELKSGCTFTNITFKFTDGTQLSPGLLFAWSTTTLSGATLSNVHLVVKNNALLSVVLLTRVVPRSASLSFSTSADTFLSCFLPIH